MPEDAQRHFLHSSIVWEIERANYLSVFSLSIPGPTHTRFSIRINGRFECTLLVLRRPASWRGGHEVFSIHIYMRWLINYATLQCFLSDLAAASLLSFKTNSLPKAFIK